MFSKLSRNQLLAIIMIPFIILFSGRVAHAILGPSGLVIPVAMTGLLLGYLIVELRNYQLGIFLRRHKETQVQFAQLEAIIGVNMIIRPVLPLPATRGWAASPDLLSEIVRQLLTKPVGLVVEAGSGASTLVIGYCLKRLDKGHVITLEHDPHFADRTRALVREHGLESYVTVVDAPLVKHKVDGENKLWYDLSRVEISSPIDLLIVDGPPNTTQPMARYPAVPLLRHHLNSRARILMDDGRRDDERATAHAWTNSFKGASLEYLDLESGGWLIQLHGEQE